MAGANKQTRQDLERSSIESVRKLFPPKQYTLVLDLDETLVHFKDSRYLTDDQKLKVRPGVAQFLE